MINSKYNIGDRVIFLYQLNAPLFTAKQTLNGTIYGINLTEYKDKPKEISYIIYYDNECEDDYIINESEIIGKRKKKAFSYKLEQEEKRIFSRIDIDICNYANNKINILKQDLKEFFIKNKIIEEEKNEHK